MPQEDSVQIIIDNVYSLLNCDYNYDHILTSVRNAFKEENDIYLWKVSKKPHLRYRYNITKKGQFYTGLVSAVYNFIKKKHGITPAIIDLRTKEGIDDSKELVDYRLENMEIKFRKYQENAIQKGLNNPRGVFVYPTGSGKTIIMSGLVAALNTKTLVVCSKVDLARQLQREISSYTGLTVGIIAGGKFEVGDITVAVVQSLTNKKTGARKKSIIEDFLLSIRYLVFDECHHNQAATWQKVSMLCKNAYYRHGFTATFMTSKIQKSTGKEQKDTNNLILHTGKVISKISIGDVVDAGYLARPEIKYIKYPHHIKRSDVRGLDYAKVYERDIAGNYDRNFLVASIASNKYKLDKQVIIFVNRISQGKMLREMLVELFGIGENEVMFISGSHSEQQKKINLAMFAAGKFPILIGTSIIGEGLNFFCDCGINASAGDSDITAVQRLGRILRKKKPGLNEDVNISEDRFVEYWEVFDTKHIWFGGHSKSRYKIYAEQGFIPREVEESDVIDNELLAEAMASLENFDPSDEEIEAEEFIPGKVKLTSKGKLE